MYNWSVIHGIKRKPHLSVVWNWYHFVAIAILHQPRPTDSADINTRLQLSDTSSIPPMHGGFLLVSASMYQILDQYISYHLLPPSNTIILIWLWMLFLKIIWCLYIDYYNLQMKLEQVERLHYEISPAAPWSPTLVIHIRSQVKTRQHHSYKF